MENKIRFSEVLKKIYDGYCAGTGSHPVYGEYRRKNAPSPERQ